TGRYWPIFDTAALLPLAALVIGASAGFKGVGGSLLMLRPVRYIGRISYGIYLYHLFVAVPVLNLASALGVGTYGLALAQTIVAVMVAAVSWHVLEGPLNGLKSGFHFPENEPLAVVEGSSVCTLSHVNSSLAAGPRATESPSDRVATPAEMLPRR